MNSDPSLAGVVYYSTLPFSLPDAASGRNVVEIVFVLPVFVLKNTSTSTMTNPRDVLPIGSTFLRLQRYHGDQSRHEAENRSVSG